MNKIGLLMGLLLSANAWAANSKPKYDFSTAAIYGEYVQAEHFNCENDSGKIVPCTGAVVEKSGKIALITLLDHDRKVPLFETENGALAFNIEIGGGDCDDPGCYNLLGISGVVYPKEVKGGKYVPAVKIFVRKDYPYPDEEDAPEGEVVEIERHIKKKK